MKFFHCACIFLLLICPAFAQTNPVPLLNQPLIPATVAPGSGAFTLTINGTGFTSFAEVYWNGSLRATTVVSSKQVTAQINAADVTKAGVASVMVSNLGAGVVSSNVVYLPIRTSAKGLGFEPRAVQNVTGFPEFTAVGDFNNDGLLDFAALEEHGIQLFLGKGNGTFQPPLMTSLGRELGNSIVAGDFNGDGNLDLATVSNTPHHSSVWVFLGKGDGTFTTKKAYLANRVSSIALTAAADFNGDGKLDLFAIMDSRNVESFGYLSGDGDGTFGGQHSASFPGKEVQEILVSNVTAIGDFNGSGRIGYAMVFLNKSGHFEIGVSSGFYPILFPASSVAAADLNGDGILDLVTDGGSVLLGKGDGTFGKDIGKATVISGRINLGDFNGDGLLDVQVGPSIALGGGKGHFQSPLTFAGLGLGLPFSVGGFNADGNLDLLGVSSSNDVLTIAVQIPVYFTPINLDFGSLILGTTSPPQTSTLTNFNTKAITITSINFSGTNASDFAETNSCGKSLPPNGTCKIQTTFTPSVVGAESAALNVTYNGSTSVSMPLSGTGLPNNTFTVTLTPSSLSFPVLFIGTTSQPQNATLTNTGNQPVTISSIVATAPFSQTNDCPATLAAGTACDITVTITPPHRGTFNGMLSVTDDAVGSPQTVALSGAGTSVVWAPTGINFGNQQVNTSSIPVPVTLSNDDTTPLPITKIAITGANPGDFSQMNDCGNSIPAQGHCTITVTFTPTAKGARSAQVSISDDDPTSPQTVPLSGKGT